ncbi:hypothetical protein [Dactylosporangium sp. CA-233914]|uniref:ATP-dependent DNA ligase n=1 Tax=Dactylosporangium sp. CA-233914 TaxID=3239934 RepID=UPI003D8B14DF
MHVGSPRPALLAAVPVRLFVFDVLHLDGHPTIQLPYHERRALLDHLGLDGDRVWVPPAFDDAAHALDIAGGGFEGIVAKVNGGRYLPGRRSSNWRKHVSIREPGCSARPTACAAAQPLAQPSATSVGDGWRAPRSRSVTLLKDSSRPSTTTLRLRSGRLANIRS